MISLIYEWNEEEYAWLLYELRDGIEYFVEKFDDREDLLIYIEKNYALVNLIVRGEK